jgi:DNA-binding transcriptional regulator YiaG
VGPVARRVEEALEVSQPYGVGALMTDVLAAARARAEHAERVAVATEITQLQAASGLTRAEFASAIGTSTSRLSTYLNGKVTPSAGRRDERVGSRSTDRGGLCRLRWSAVTDDPTIPMRAVRHYLDDLLGLTPGRYPPRPAGPDPDQPPPDPCDARSGWSGPTLAGRRGSPMPRRPAGPFTPGPPISTRPPPP